MKDISEIAMRKRLYRYLFLCSRFETLRFGLTVHTATFGPARTMLTDSSDTKGSIECRMHTSRHKQTLNHVAVVYLP